MHIVATNLCVWVRTLVRESLKEINEFRVSQGHKGEDYMILGELHWTKLELGYIIKRLYSTLKYLLWINEA